MTSRQVVCRTLFFGVSVAAFSAKADPSVGALRPTDPRVEYQSAPVGLDTPRPRFSWTLTPRAQTPEARGERQTGYQILAASAPDLLKLDQGDLWDSGHVRSADQLSIVYRGRPLNSGKRVFFKVRVWDRAGIASPYGTASTFDMALLSPSDWKGRFIEEDVAPPTTDDDLWRSTPAPLFRRDLNLAKPIARARVHVTGLGYYELSINGKRVGDQVLDPGWTNYSKRVLYATHDVTGMLTSGKNTLGILVGNGWWNPLPIKMFRRWKFREILPSGAPRALLQLEIDYADGSHETIETDTSWKVGASGLLRNDVYLGEFFDARKHPTGWDKPGFDDSAWRPARLVTQNNSGMLKAQDAPPIKITRTLKPFRLTEPKPGQFVFDFGQNFAGTVTLRARGPAGTRITLRFAELLASDGTLNGTTTFAGQIKTRDQNNVPTPPEAGSAPANAWQQDVWILAGKGDESYTPRFTFHGFRYVSVEGLTSRPTLDDIDGLRLNSATPSVGTFSTSNDLWNRIREATLWAQQSNMFSVHSDCPHREKLGYGGDIVAAIEMAMLHFDAGRFYAKAARDMADAARPNGGLTETSPFVGIEDNGFGSGVGPMGWTVAHPVLLETLWRYQGDRALVEEQYPVLVRHLGFLKTQIKDGITDRDISDHEMLGDRPRGLTATAFYFQTATIAAHLAGVLGKKADQIKWKRLADGISSAFNKKFLDTSTGRYADGTQTAQSFALFQGLVPSAARKSALDRLVESVTNQKDHFTTGIFATKYLLDLLPTTGHADLAARLVSQRAFPGFGYMIDNGATTLWEAWKKDERILSHNHAMFGSVLEYFTKHVAGIAPASDAVGFDRIVLRPHPTPELSWATGRYQSVRGDIVSDWRIANHEFVWDVVVPVGVVQATAHVPVAAADILREGKNIVEKALGVRVIRREAKVAVLELSPGRYRFTAPF